MFEPLWISLLRSPGIAATAWHGAYRCSVAAGIRHLGTLAQVALDHPEAVDLAWVVSYGLVDVEENHPGWPALKAAATPDQRRALAATIRSSGLLSHLGRLADQLEEGPEPGGEARSAAGGSLTDQPPSELGDVVFRQPALNLAWT
ncbi:MAG: hypothetical protein HY906_15050 [Deltaproteobacteria bacterium]|nr:hypothetical protein [Deltaproteobacteria bacterium]